MNDDKYYEWDLFAGLIPLFMYLILPILIIYFGVSGTVYRREVEKIKASQVYTQMNK